MALGLDAIKFDLGQGARVNKYKVTISDLGGTVESLAKATSLPGHTIGQAEVFSQGRKVPLAGDATYDTWDCTFYNDVDLSINQKCHDWMKKIDDFEANTSADTDLTDYGKDVTVQQLDRAQSPTKTFLLKNAWPTSVSEVSLSADTDGGVSEFTCTFAYTHYTVS